MGRQKGKGSSLNTNPGKCRSCGGQGNTITQTQEWNGKEWVWVTATGKCATCKGTGKP